MKNKKYCVVVPVYKKYSTLDEKELICLESIYRNYPIEIIYWIIPNSLDMTGYKYIDEKHLYRLNDRFFLNTTTYSDLCLRAFFYEHFNEYEYLLIHQLDAYTRVNNIDYFIELGYDYYGAPCPARKWNGRQLLCGNGGLSLRNIDAMIRFCNNFPWDKESPEDWFICINHKNDLNICPVNIGVKFSVEKYYGIKEKLPMGCHKLWNYNSNLWNKIINSN